MKFISRWEEHLATRIARKHGMDLYNIAKKSFLKELSTGQYDTDLVRAVRDATDEYLSREK